MFKPSFIGRDTELAQLNDALRPGSGGGAVVIGPSGVGRTRLVTEASGAVAASGRQVLRVDGTAATRDVPLGALAPLLSDRLERGASEAEMIRRGAQAILEAGTSDKVLLVVDDVHLLDRISGAVLHHLASVRHVHVLLTTQEGAGAPGSIDALWADHVVGRVDLAPLDRPAADTLARELLGVPPDRTALNTLWRLSEGNPLHLRELVTDAQRSHSVIVEDDVARLRPDFAPTGRLVDLVQRRLEGLDDKLLHAVEFVALGAGQGLQLLNDCAGADEIEACERLGLLTVREDDRRLRVYVASELLTEVLVATMPRTARARISRQLADAVESLGARRHDDALMIAQWRLAGGGDVEPEVFATAAEDAFCARDEVLGERLARLAIRAGAGARAAITLGSCLEGLGRSKEAEVVLAEVPIDDLEPDLLVAWARTRSTNLFWGMGRHRGAVDALDAALARLPAGSIDASGALLAWRAGLNGTALSPDAALDDAVAEALNSDGWPRVAATLAAAPALTLMGRCDDAIALVDAALVVAESEPEQPEGGMLLWARSFALETAGRLTEAELLALTGLQHSVDFGAAAGIGSYSIVLARLLVTQGRLADADRYFTEAAIAHSDAGQPANRRWALSGRLLVAGFRSDSVRARTLLDELNALPTGPLRVLEPEVERARAWFEVSTGDIDAASRRLQAAAEDAKRLGSKHFEVLLCFDIVRLGRPGDVVDRLSELAAEVQGHAMTQRLDHTRALIDRDADTLLGLSHDYETTSAYLLAAETAAQAADVLRRRSRAGDAEAAAQRATALRRRCQGAATPALDLAANREMLTRRESEIARLAAAGLTTKAVAEQLFISPRTVDNHLHRAYAKLGVSGKADLKAALDADG